MWHVIPKTIDFFIESCKKVLIVLIYPWQITFSVKRHFVYYLCFRADFFDYNKICGWQLCCFIFCERQLFLCITKRNNMEVLFRLKLKKQFAESQQNSTICGKQDIESWKFSPAAPKNAPRKCNLRTTNPKVFLPCGKLFLQSAAGEKNRFILVCNGDFYRKMGAAGEIF